MRIGETINFVPCFAADDKYTRNQKLKHEKKVSGRIVGVHRAHHWYMVEFVINGYVMHECFRYIPAGNELIGKEGSVRAGHHKKM